MFIARRRDRPSEAQVSPRAEWYDRNPSDQSVGYLAVAVAPHTTTTRATYTVPTGRKAFITALHAEVYRRDAPTTAGKVYAQVFWSGVVMLKASHLNATVGSVERSSVGVDNALMAGDTVFIETCDLSTGGTMDYQVGVAIVEFDA